MWVSLCETFKHGDTGWDTYQTFINLPHLHEVRTIDSGLNDVLEGMFSLLSLHELPGLLADLVLNDESSQYLQLAINVSEHALPSPLPTAILLGFDLADETHTSSLLNCGAWTGELLPFTSRLNRYGLLTLADATAVQAMLPQLWNGDPHANADIWAVYELVSARQGRES